MAHIFPNGKPESCGIYWLLAAGIPIELSMNRRKLLKRLSQGALDNVAFSDLRNLVEGLGFRLARIKGSHHVFVHPAIPELINLQEVKGRAKPYQVRQLLRLAERYNLRLKEGG